MGTFSVSIEVARPYGSEFRSMDALVDTGASYCVFPSDVLTNLGVVVEENRTFELADNRVTELPVGHATVRVAGKQVITLVVFGPEGVAPLLGATALELSGLAVDPLRQLLVPVNALLMSGLNGSLGNGTANNGSC